MTSPCVRFLRDYVAIPSVNPMGRSDLPAEIVGERRYAEHLREQLRSLHLDAELIGQGERQSVVAEVCSARASETIVVASHLDTVPIDGMEIDPFDPHIEGERLYGRGSCDTKGGMAALVDALERVLRKDSLRRNLILVGEADEEFASAGARAVVELLGKKLPTWAIATEPTELHLVNRHKGVAHLRFVARGRACHSSDPTQGANAIVRLARAVLALDHLAGDLARAVDPELGSGTLSPGIISGGHAFNIVPDRAQLIADRRMLPGESAESVRSEIEAALKKAGAEDVQLETCQVEKPPLRTAEDHVAVRACCGILRSLQLPAETTAVAFGTDGGIFAECGIPSVVMGPGSITRAHTAREYVEIPQVEAMTEFFVRLLEGQS